MVYGYVLLILVATPYLPSLIQWSSSKWSGESVARFVLGAEITMGSLLIVLAGGAFFYNRRKDKELTDKAKGKQEEKNSTMEKDIISNTDSINDVYEKVDKHEEKDEKRYNNLIEKHIIPMQKEISSISASITDSRK